MELTARQLAEVLHGTVEGDAEAKVTSFAKVENFFTRRSKVRTLAHTSRGENGLAT